MERVFRMRRVGGKGRGVMVLTVPAAIANEIDPATAFTCELTEDGVLYRPVKPQEPVLPAWVKRQKKRK